MSKGDTLVVAPAWVGDMVMAQVLFTCLKQQYPHTAIDVIAPMSSRSLLQFMPEVRHAIALDTAHGEFAWRKRRQLGKQLRSGDYQQAIITPNSFKSALVPFWANIPTRTGWLGEQRYLLLNDYRRLDKTQYPLMIERFAALAYAKGDNIPDNLIWPSFDISQANVEKSLQQLQLNAPSKPMLAICPGAEFGPSKRWPAKYFAQVAQQKLAQGWEVWLFGSAKEKTASDIIQDKVNHACINIIGKTSLAQATYLLSLANAAVTNDSGLMHILAALSIPMVAIYGSSSTAFTPPLSQNVQTLSLNLSCSPCFQRECPLKHLNCLKKLSPSLVIEQLNSLYF